MHDEPIFFQRKDVLDMEEASYLSDLLFRVVKVGVELEFAMPKGVMREQFQPRIEKLMQPTRDMGRLGPLGVFDVVPDHSGIEVQVIGRRPHWGAMIRQYEAIVEKLLPMGIRMPATCGLHYHLLCLDTCESLPEIVLANFWNLSRKYSPGLKFLTSGGPGRKAMCRRRQHNSHQEFLRQSPANKSMAAIQQELRGSFLVPEHQNFFNLEHMRFLENGDIRELHVELRFPDGNLSPTAITAQTFLFVAMLLKSVEISKYGLLHVGKVREWSRKKELMDCLSNNDGWLATSDTSGVTPEMEEELRQNGLDLLAFLQNVLVILNTPADGVLRELARRPVSLRRHDGEDWSEIEAGLAAVAGPRGVPDEHVKALTRVVELGLVTRATGPGQWYRRAAVSINSTVDAVMQGLVALGDRIPVWNRERGSMVFQR